MILPKAPLDDFKIERKDITPPLPGILRIVPIFLYLSVVAGILLSGIFLLQLKMARDGISGYEKGLADVTVEMATLAEERTQLERKILKATDIQKWVQGSGSIQPLLVSISRSISPDASLADLKLERDDTTPSALKLGLRIGTTSVEQLEKTTDAVSSESYRLLQPEQTLAEGEITYRATIIPYRDSSVSQNQENQTPQNQ